MYHIVLVHFNSLQTVIRVSVKFVFNVRTKNYIGQYMYIINDITIA